MNAILIRTTDFDLSTLERIKDLSNVFEGPLKFSVDTDELNFETKILFPEFVFERIKAWRQTKEIADDAFVCLYTESRLSNNFFTMGDGYRNYIIHSGDWKYYGSEDPVFADSYLLYSNILKEQVYQSDVDLLFSKLHKTESRGCYLDFCINKKEIFLKLRTADICSDCISDIKSSKVDPRFLSQVIEAFEGLRKQLLFRNRFEIELKPSRIILNKRNQFILPDYGNIELKFSPLRKAIYKLFLENKEGFLFTELPDCLEKLIEYYSFFQPNKTKEEVRRTMTLVCDPFSDRMHEEISKINAEINKKLGDKVSEFYKISGDRNEKRKINVSGYNF